ncbi:2-phospho-L-lactate transferase [Tengunoibacter tsumagoiensis]|uniref:LPPG--FO 2-phospho-L-lactate transferase n=1 Tax=Tengunoibacter tsumagoiensis TaxID=2014871 RepID=A0A402A0X1_9CHLR|nr:2-phospho-L-lactate transferase [Tengunoibacter tsumagoiensis]GCE12706.1 LPPG--FO 2-phospho-L-lactate transferase [Tengunoibacter tsumagoiensis]
MIVVLAGGVGAARFLQGVVQIVPQEQITVIANTGDDREFYGLHVSPDVDIVLYTLAGLVDEAQGWGLRHDTYHAMKQLTSYGNEDWFNLGDRDLATHIHRTNLLRQGKTLSEITNQLKNSLGLQITMLPMSNQSVETHIQTPTGLIHFEEYMVKRRFADEVLDVVFVGAQEAKPAPGVIEAIRNAEAVFIAPSNPIVSIGTILSVPGIHNALHETSAMVVAVSPIVGGAPIKGPADKIMRGLHREVSAVGVARGYRDFLDVMVIDQQDAHLATEIEDLGIPTVVTDTIMRDLTAKKALAQVVIEAAGLQFS